MASAFPSMHLRYKSLEGEELKQKRGRINVFAKKDLLDRNAKKERILENGAIKLKLLLTFAGKVAK